MFTSLNRLLSIVEDWENESGYTPDIAGLACKLGLSQNTTRNVLSVLHTLSAIAESTTILQNEHPERRN